MASMPAKMKRNIIFFGETGAGKSSTINLLLGGTLAQVSNDAQLCTRAYAYYETMLDGKICNLWDTRGLGGGLKFFRTFFGGKSERELKKFLKERYENREIDLLVFCIRGSRTTKASSKYYNTFCTITRQLAAPVVVVVTHLERVQENMEDWWKQYSPALRQFNMEFDGYACVTTLPNHSRATEAKKKLVDMITKEYHWKAERDGSYFGSRARRCLPRASVHSGVSSIFKPKEDNDNRGSIRRHNSAGPSSPSTMEGSSFHTADGGSVPPTHIVELSTPFSAPATPKLPSIDTNRLGSGYPSRSSNLNEETPSTGSSAPSTLDPSSHTSHFEFSPCVYSELKPCTDGTEGKEPFKYSGATVKRRGGYAVQRGAFGDVWQCDLIFGKTTSTVAVKAVNTCHNSDKPPGYYEKTFRRELRVWEKLQHSNIVPLLGVVFGFGPLPSMVSPWFRNGSLSSYLGHHQISMMDKQCLFGDIATGLCYLHSQDVVHGDLHSDNVLINDRGRACLTDFGLSLNNEFVGTSYLRSGFHGCIQFADPALVQRVNGAEGNAFYPSKPCDVYSFGGLMLHILSGKKPYQGMASGNIILTVMRGERPQIPPDAIPHWHKSLMRRCWDPEEHKRPSAHDLPKLFDRETPEFEC